MDIMIRLRMEFYIFPIQKLRKKKRCLFAVFLVFFLLANLGCGNDGVTCHKLLLYLMNWYVIIIRNICFTLIVFIRLNTILKTSADRMNSWYTRSIHLIFWNWKKSIHFLARECIMYNLIQWIFIGSHSIRHNDYKYIHKNVPYVFQMIRRTWQERMDT